MPACHYQPHIIVNAHVLKLLYNITMHACTNHSPGFYFGGEASIDIGGRQLVDDF